MRGKPRTTLLTGGTLLLFALSTMAPAGNSFSSQGSYRPVENRGASGNAQGQFPPVENRNAQRWTSTQPLPSPTLPAQPQVPATGYQPYAPSGYGASTYPQPAYPQPTYVQPSYVQPAYPQATYTPTVPRYDNQGWNPPPLPDPTNILDDFFGTRRNDTVGGYLPPPVLPVAPPVAPVYNPPVPAAPLQPPAYSNYGYAYPQQQQQVPTSYPGQQNWSQPPGSTPAPQPPAQPAQATPTPPQATAQAPKPAAPRPFSNPQESGSNFTPRSITIQPGRNDSRFRPPELKGTP